MGRTFRLAIFWFFWTFFPHPRPSLYPQKGIAKQQNVTEKGNTGQGDPGLMRTKLDFTDLSMQCLVRLDDVPQKR